MIARPAFESYESLLAEAIASAEGLVRESGDPTVALPYLAGYLKGLLKHVCNERDGLAARLQALRPVDPFPESED